MELQLGAIIGGALELLTIAAMTQPLWTYLGSTTTNFKWAVANRFCTQEKTPSTSCQYSKCRCTRISALARTTGLTDVEDWSQ